jgi:ribosomal-protein-alanine N-acetyltransferase
MFPELDTPHYSLKKITAADQPFIFEGLSHPQVIPFYGVRYYNLKATKAQMEFYESIWKEKTGCWWKIVSRESGKPVGACGMNFYQPVHEKAEIGYWLLPKYWKKGIMPEVLPVMLKHLFETWKLYRIEAVIEQGNTASCKLSEKLGFTLEGKLRDAEIKNGKRVNLLLYSLLKTDLSHLPTFGL